MSRENIRVAQPNFATDGAFYYSISKDSGVLQVKVDDGTVAFSYALDTSPVSEVTELEWDGVFFWSLENHMSSDATPVTDGFIIRKWAIDDFICKQITKFDFIDDATHTYRATSMAVESYNSSVGLGNNDGSGNGYTGVNLQKDIFLYDTSRMSVGDIVYFVKRDTPAQNRYGSTNIEQLIVNSVISSTKVSFGTNTVGDPYGDSRGWRGAEANPSASEPLPPDEVRWTKYLWVFNEYSTGPSSVPGLYKINAYTGAIVSQDSGSQYGSIGASTFYTQYNTAPTPKTDPDHPESLTYNTSIVNTSSAGGPQVYVVYIKNAACLFYNVTSGATDRSLLVDNVKVDTVSVWPSYDLVIVGVEPDVVLLRLQLGTTYKNGTGTLIDESWGTTYSYERTLLRRHVQSIALTVTPSIVPITTGFAAVVAHLRDQYNDTVPAGVTVYFADDDSGAGEASVSPTSASTDYNGRAHTVFYAGDTEKDVKITASSTWVST